MPRRGALDSPKPCEARSPAQAGAFRDPDSQGAKARMSKRLGLRRTWRGSWPPLRSFGLPVLRALLRVHRAVGCPGTVACTFRVVLVYCRSSSTPPATSARDGPPTTDESLGSGDGTSPALRPRSGCSSHRPREKRHMSAAGCAPALHARRDEGRDPFNHHPRQNRAIR
jgi:hypothetical protein